MSPAQKAARLREIVARIRAHRLQIMACEMAVRGLDPDREEIPTEEQIEAVSELLQDIAARMDEHAGSIEMEAGDEERAA